MSRKLTSRYILSLLLAVLAIFRCGTAKIATHYELSSMPRSCTEAMGILPARSGIYNIFLPASGLRPFKVYCLEDELGEAPWTIIQRRLNGDTDFFRGWEEYKRGFGDLNENFWLGLDKISALTIDQWNNPHELWVSLTDTDFSDARYNLFAVGNEFEQFKLKALGNYSGTAGNSLRYHINEKFSTYDFDNDQLSTINCARNHLGAWWYYQCYRSNLNGNYEKTFEWIDHPNRLKKTSLMAVRPTKK